MNDILVIGGDSMIGHALADTGADRKVAVTTRRDGHSADRIPLDLASPEENWPALPDAKTWIICAAVARNADCRNDPETSHRVNVDAVRVLARLAAERGIRVIFLSTDQVFDGSEPHRPASDTTCPSSEYGKQKAAAEDSVRKAAAGNLIIRLTKVLSPADQLFESWCAALRGGAQITPFTDKTFAPVALDTVCGGILSAADQKISGVLQFSGPEDVTYAEMARRLANIMGAEKALVAPRAAADTGMPPEERPPFTTLDTSRAESDLGMTFAAPGDLVAAIAQTQH